MFKRYLNNISFSTFLIVLLLLHRNIMIKNNVKNRGRHFYNTALDHKPQLFVYCCGYNSQTLMIQN